MIKLMEFIRRMTRYLNYKELISRTSIKFHLTASVSLYISQFELTSRKVKDFRLYDVNFFATKWIVCLLSKCMISIAE